MTSKEAIENIKRSMIIGRHGNIDVGNKSINGKQMLNSLYGIMLKK